MNACVALAKDWRTDKYLRRLEVRCLALEVLATGGGPWRAFRLCWRFVAHAVARRGPVVGGFGGQFDRRELFSSAFLSGFPGGIRWFRFFWFCDGCRVMSDSLRDMLALEYSM